MNYDLYSIAYYRSAVVHLHLTKVTEILLVHEYKAARQVESSTRQKPRVYERKRREYSCGRLADFDTTRRRNTGSSRDQNNHCIVSAAMQSHLPPGLQGSGLKWFIEREQSSIQYS
jgi:hypothetical protein